MPAQVKRVGYLVGVEVDARVADPCGVGDAREVLDVLLRQRHSVTVRDVFLHDVGDRLQHEVVVVLRVRHFLVALEALRRLYLAREVRAKVVVQLAAVRALPHRRPLSSI